MSLLMANQALVLSQFKGVIAFSQLIRLAPVLLCTTHLLGRGACFMYAASCGSSIQCDLLVYGVDLCPFRLFILWFRYRRPTNERKRQVSRIYLYSGIYVNQLPNLASFEVPRSTTWLQGSQVWQHSIWQCTHLGVEVFSTRLLLTPHVRYPYQVRNPKLTCLYRRRRSCWSKKTWPTKTSEGK
jgi:hypothetical protein